MWIFWRRHYQFNQIIEAKELKEKKNLECKSYDYEDPTKLAQKKFRICVFCKVRRHVITKCPHIDSEVRDGFVTHVGQ
jgi:hypothetical protein